MFKEQFPSFKNEESSEDREKRYEEESKEKERTLERKLSDNSLAMDRSPVEGFKYTEGEFGHNVYYSNNGITAFVDSMGTLFVSPDPKKTSELSSFGYKESSQVFVPFSNGEKPSDRDPIFKKKWEELLEEFKK